jgi:NADH dehydrogenase FAD-containing subunit
MARALAVLKRQRIAVLPQAAEAVAADHVLLAGGARVACQAPVLAVGGCAPAWLATSGLAVTASGHVRIGATLQSVSHPEVFAAGDVSARDDVAHPRSGVYAVRAGPPLAANLRAWVAGGALQPHRPPQRTLNLVSCGQREAIAAWGPLAAQGRWVWHWKDRIDRGFIARYRSPPAVGPGAVVPRT